MSPATQIEALYSRAGKPGLASTTIEAAFAGDVAKLPLTALRPLAERLDVAPLRRSKADLLARMKANVLNRAGMHGRVKI